MGLWHFFVFILFLFYFVIEYIYLFDIELIVIKILTELPNITIKLTYVKNHKLDYL